MMQSIQNCASLPKTNGEGVMRRDMDLIRAILEKIEARTGSQIWNDPWGCAGEVVAWAYKGMA